MAKRINWDTVTKWVAILSVPLTVRTIIELVKMGLGA